MVFRRHDETVKGGKADAGTKGFLDLKKYATEQERRSDLGKWETVLHGDNTLRGSSLENPVLDIHYNTREAGGSAAGRQVPNRSGTRSSFPSKRRSTQMCPMKSCAHALKFKFTSIYGRRSSPLGMPVGDRDHQDGISDSVEGHLDA